MIKLKKIVESIITPSKKISEGGKLFGPRAVRVTTDEMNKVFREISSVLAPFITRMELSRALKTKADHGDIDIVVLNDKNHDLSVLLKTKLGDGVKDYSKNGNIYSILYASSAIGKTVHVDILNTVSQEQFDPHWEYLSYNDFSGILGVLSRRVKFNYGTGGFFKIYVDKKGQFHYIHITNDLRKGLKILGYNNIERYDSIETVDDIVEFISSSPLFDSEYYVGQDMNHSDRKRVRTGRPIADYIRKKLIELNVRRKIDDDDHFFKTLFPSEYSKYVAETEKIENTVIPKSKYNGEWLMKNFPEVKPGPRVGKVLKFWFDTYKDKMDEVPEEELLSVTKDFLHKQSQVK
jgi:hypothetical protein